MNRLTADRAALLLIVAFALLAIFTSRAVPPFESADEMPHFLNVHLLLEARALPLIPTRDALREADARGDTVAQWAIETHQPPAYYAVGALLTSWTRRDDLQDYLRPNTLIFTRGISENNANKWLHNPNAPRGDTHLALWTLRLYSLTLACATLWLIYQAAALVFDRRAGLLALALTASIHTFASIGASVNNDNLVTLLYTLGVYVALRMWHTGRITPRGLLVMSLTLSAIALTKITGAGLFVIVYGAWLFGAWRGRWPWRDAARAVLITGITAALLAGWWYVRNWQLYGDPLALAATQVLWGRTFANAQESTGGLAEAGRVWRSFWFMTGHLHQPVYGPRWLDLYAPLAVMAAFVGVIFGRRRVPAFTPARRDMTLILIAAALMPVALLITGTRSVDISYGRLLFPALIGAAPLLALGWRGVLGRYAPLFVLPFTAAAVLAPLVILPDAYPRLARIDTLPASAIPVGARVDGLEVVAYERLTDATPPDGEARFMLYLRGAHPDNPALVAQVIDPVTLDALGTVTVYPGSAPTDSLLPDALYAAPLRVTLTPAQTVSPPRLLRLTLGWQTVTDTDYLPVSLPDAPPADVITLDAATLIDTRYTTPPRALDVRAEFGGMIALDGATLEPQTVRAGDAVTLNLWWRDLAPMDADYVLTVQVIDAAGELVMQADGDVAGYPTSAWRGGTRFVDTRTLNIPPDVPPADYRVYVGWYRLDDLTRLPASGVDVWNALIPLPVNLTVTADDTP